MKKFIFILLAVGALGGGYYAYQVYFNPQAKLDLIYAVPKDAALVIEFDDPFKAWEEINQSPAWNRVKTNPFFQDIAHYTDSLNEAINQYAALYKLVGSRPVILSLHPVLNKLEYFFATDLKEGATISGIKNILLPILEKYYRIHVREYHGHEILELYDTKEKETLYLSVVDNLLIGAYKHVLVEASIDQKEEPGIGRDIRFVEVKEKVGYEGMCRVYVQYDVLIKSLRKSFTGLPLLETLDQTFYYSGFDFSFENSGQTLSMKGYTTVNDTVHSFFTLFGEHDRADITIPDIVYDRTALLLHLGFEDALSFYGKIEDNLKKDVVGFKDYQENKKKLEDFLDISFQEHVLGWMDNEMGIVQGFPSSGKAENEYSLVIKAKEGSLAKEKLDFVEERIRKKTPVRFKAISHRGYEIHFISVKGFFRIFLGKLFSKLEKPFYTIIDDYVIFSNHPNTLRHIINHYLDGKVLSKNSDFMAQKADFSNTSSVFVYLNTAYLISSNQQYLSASLKSSLEKNKEYLSSFPMAGFQLQSSSGAYAMHFSLPYRNADEAVNLTDMLMAHIEAAPGDSAAMDSLSAPPTAHYSEEELISLDDIEPEDLNAKNHQEFYEDGKLRMEVTLKDGMKHGDYREYSKEGNIIRKGSYKNDKMDGVWKMYDQRGRTVEKVRYRNGEKMD